MFGAATSMKRHANEVFDLRASATLRDVGTRQGSFGECSFANTPPVLGVIDQG